VENIAGGLLMLSLIKRWPWVFGLMVLTVFTAILLRNDFQQYKQKQLVSFINTIKYEMNHDIVANLTLELRAIADSPPQMVDKQAFTAKLSQIVAYFDGCNVKGIAFSLNDPLEVRSSDYNHRLTSLTFNYDLFSKWITQVDGSVAILDHSQKVLIYDVNSFLTIPAFEESNSYIAVIECPNDASIRSDMIKFMDLFHAVEP
jgi:hypothetical protein